jgi:hypothetical protein
VTHLLAVFVISFLFSRDRMLDRRKDRNIAAASKDKGAKLRNEKDRDISEKIALGIADPRAGAGRGGGEGTQFDERLFNQSQVGTVLICFAGNSICAGHRRRRRF